MTYNKNLILALVLCLGFAVQLSAQDEGPSDLAAIETTLNNYLIGGTQKDAKRIASAFHPQAMMKYVKDGEYVEVNAAQFFLDRTKAGPPSDRKTYIVSVDIAGEAAFARLRIDYPEFSFHDYMALLKIDGEWLIINKSFSRQQMPN